MEGGARWVSYRECGWDQLTGDLEAIRAWQRGEPQLKSKTHMTHGSALTLL